MRKCLNIGLKCDPVVIWPDIDQAYPTGYFLGSMSSHKKKDSFHSIHSCIFPSMANTKEEWENVSIRNLKDEPVAIKPNIDQVDSAGRFLD